MILLSLFFNLGRNQKSNLISSSLVSRINIQLNNQYQRTQVNYLASDSNKHLPPLPQSANNSSPFEEQSQYWNEYVKYYEKNLKDKNVDTMNSNETTNTSLLDAQFTHLNNETNRPQQVDISEKAHTNKIRVARASGYIQLNEFTFNSLVQNKLKKGNALLVSQIAGIQASKKTSDLIPLCHQINLDVCNIDFKLDSVNSRIYCEATCKTSISKTGVEIEALCACSIALLTIYDMVKAVQKDACINDIKLDYKYGGKSDYLRQN